MGRTVLGYMGIPFSNSEEMAVVFSRKFGFEDVELVPLMNSRNVIDALLNGRIEYGVMAVENKFAGIVIESRDAMEGV